MAPWHSCLTAGTLCHGACPPFSRRRRRRSAPHGPDRHRRGKSKVKRFEEGRGHGNAQPAELLQRRNHGTGDHPQKGPPAARPGLVAAARCGDRRGRNRHANRGEHEQRPAPRAVGHRDVAADHVPVDKVLAERQQSARRAPCGQAEHCPKPSWKLSMHVCFRRCSSREDGTHPNHRFTRCAQYPLQSAETAATGSERTLTTLIV